VPDDDKLRCPRCGRLWWGDREAAFAERCPACGGSYLRPHLVAQILGEELGFAPGELRAREQGEASEGLAGCPSCEGPLSHASLDDTGADLCLRCGSAWFDAGELERLSHGRHREQAAPGGLARQYLPKAARPGGHQRYVRVPPASTLRTLAGGALVGISMLGVFVPMIPLAGFALGGLLAYQRGVVLDLERRKVASITSLGFHMRGTWHDWGDFSRVAVRSEGVRSSSASGPQFRFSVSLVGDGVPDLLVVRTKQRVLAHRYGFQISQLAGLPVEHPQELEASA